MLGKQEGNKRVLDKTILAECHECHERDVLFDDDLSHVKTEGMEEMVMR